MANCSSDRILIIGAGEVGLATAMRLAKEMPEGGQIHLRTLSSDSLQSRLHELQRRCPPAIATAGSTGDVFFSADLPDESADLARRARVDYLLAPTSAATLRRSSIFRLIEAVRPTIIIDTVNAAYVTRAAAASVLDIARDLHGLHESTADGARAAIARCADDIVLGNGPAIIARYIAALELALREFNVDRYVRVSTTGLGGMGFNCPYTHGEASANVGEALAQKLATSGALHQLLWNLHHSSGADVALIVPAALIGWERVQCGPIKSRGRVVPLLDCTITATGSFATTQHACASASELLETVYTPAGDSSHYTIEEMALSTSIGQFEALTKEEVARAVCSAAFGDRSNDLLTFMDKAALGPSYAGAIRRTTLLKEMRDLARANNVVSIASGNFGPAISKALFELHFLSSALGDVSPEQGLLATDASAIATIVERHVLECAPGRSHALSLGHTIIFGAFDLSPCNAHSLGDAARDLAAIDLRAANIAAWQDRIAAALPTIESLARFSTGPAAPGAGEILAGVHLSEGKHRHLSFPLEDLNA